MTARCHQGFSLIELLAVIAIMTVAVTFVVINLGAMTPSTRLTSEGRFIASMITQAKDEAAISGYPIGIGYDLEVGEVWIDVPLVLMKDHEFEDTQERERLSIHRLPKGVEIISVDLDAHRSYNSATVVLDFMPTGIAPAHIVHLRSTEIDGHDVWLQVNPLTAEVRMTYSGDEEFQREPDPPNYEDITDASFSR